ncbi:hypothetical protein ACWGKW_21015 [Streptomyces sp. NPDC054766]|uniref:hypothetical protein n=1 Tax=Streptomyces rhizosphaerihabitans TaxID=1266770 RepID=UPI0021BFE1C9|nr:hypothetical protein [Streptomyces rhizosphaerihabitans]MCT9011219.1 hypothetical protein [Streptomyces rhizosphaerihabitans]
MEGERRRPDAADLVVAGCGWLLIVAVIASPGLLLNDGPLTAYMAVVGGVTGLLWVRKRLYR